MNTEDQNSEQVKALLQIPHGAELLETLAAYEGQHTEMLWQIQEQLLSSDLFKVQETIDQINTCTLLRDLNKVVDVLLGRITIQDPLLDLNI